ncbi:hypothetical protein IVA99_22285 [Bradyrhizobium sp. 162]|nr:hypothetical protein [Bradyrhizobium sp. 162]
MPSREIWEPLREHYPQLFFIPARPLSAPGCTRASTRTSVMASRKLSRSRMRISRSTVSFASLSRVR